MLGTKVSIHLVICLSLLCAVICLGEHGISGKIHSGLEDLPTTSSFAEDAVAWTTSLKDADSNPDKFTGDLVPEFHDSNPKTKTMFSKKIDSLQNLGLNRATGKGKKLMEDRFGKQNEFNHPESNPDDDSKRVHHRFRRDPRQIQMVKTFSNGRDKKRQRIIKRSLEDLEETEEADILHNSRDSFKTRDKWPSSNDAYKSEKFPKKRLNHFEKNEGKRRKWEDNYLRVWGKRVDPSASVDDSDVVESALPVSTEINSMRKRRWDNLPLRVWG